MCALLVLLATLLSVSAVSEQEQSDHILRDTWNGNGLNSYRVLASVLVRQYDVCGTFLRFGLHFGRKRFSVNQASVVAVKGLGAQDTQHRIAW